MVTSALVGTTILITVAPLVGYVASVSEQARRKIELPNQKRKFQKNQMVKNERSNQS